MSKYRVILETKAIAHKWWGQMWCQNIDNYADFTNRLERGRAYVRSGRVHDIMIEKGNISAKVDGSMDEPYDVLIMIDPLPPFESQKLLNKIVNLNAFKDGCVPEDYKFLFSVESGGLFPREDELSFGCTCPDVAIMCKHIAAVLYAVGSIIDQEPLLLFQLRGIDVDAYLDAEIREKTNQLLVKAKNFDDNSRLIEDNLISEFFGIEIGELYAPEHAYSVENTTHATNSEIRTIIIGHAPKVPRQKPPQKEKPVLPDRMVIRQFGLEGTFIAQFENYDEAFEKTGIPKRAMMRNICGEKKSGGGFLWKKVPANTEQTDIEPLQYIGDPQKKPVCQYRHDGILVAEYNSISEASRETGITTQAIRKALNEGTETKGFTWLYKELITSHEEERQMNIESTENETEIRLVDEELLPEGQDAQSEATVADASATSNSPDGSNLSIVIGKDIQGNALVQNMAVVPHMLVVGYSGTGKTAFIETKFAMMASSNSPEDVRFIIYSSKPSDYILFKDVPHLFVPIVYDQTRLIGALQWTLIEIFRRLRSFSEVNAKDLDGYNTRCAKRVPHMYIVIDDYYELIRFGDSSVIDTIKQILTNGRQAGIHLVVITSTPSAKVLQKDILSGFPCRACFAVASKADSRLTIDQNSAFGLESPGEMVFKTYSSAQKCRAAYMDEDTLLKAVSVIKSKYPTEGNTFSDNPPETFINSYDAYSKRNNQAQNEISQVETNSNYDEHLNQAVEAVLEMGTCSVSTLQRRVKLSYSRAARLVDQMEELGIVGPYEGAKPRTVLVDREEWEQLKRSLGSSEEDIASEQKNVLESRDELDKKDESVNSDEDRHVNDINKTGEEQAYVRPFPKFDVGNAAFRLADNRVYISKVVQTKNNSGAFSASFSVGAIREIVLKKPRLFTSGYFQFVLEDDADIEIKPSNYSDLDASEFTHLSKTSFARNQANTVYSFLNQLSNDANLEITAV